MARVIATVLAIVLAWWHGIFTAQRRGFCAYCHARLGMPPENLDHWETCPIHPARLEVARLRALLDERTGTGS
jgi:hypothetical protein